MKLVDALLNIQYDSSWGVWAELDEEGKLTEDADARYGQRVFENGGLLDDKVYVCNGTQVGDWLNEWCDGCDHSELDPFWIDEFLGELNQVKAWEQQAVC